MQTVRNAGYKPIRAMFYYPNRVRAQRIQKNLGNSLRRCRRRIPLWKRHMNYIQKYTGVDLKDVLEKIV